MRLDLRGEESSFAAISERFADHRDLALFLETASQNDPATNGEVSVRLLRESLRSNEDLVTDQGPWAVFIDGDLETSADLICSTGEYRVSSTLVVTGTVRARNLHFHTSARVVIGRDLVVENLVVGAGGDSGALLGAGTIDARLVVLDSNTCISAHHDLRAIVIGGRGWQEFVPDISDAFDHHPSIFDSGVFRADLGKIPSIGKLVKVAWDQRAAGPLLAPDIELGLRAAKGLPALR